MQYTSSFPKSEITEPRTKEKQQVDGYNMLQSLCASSWDHSHELGCKNQVTIAAIAI